MIARNNEVIQILRDGIGGDPEARREVSGIHSPCRAQEPHATAIEPIVTEETIPEAKGECNLRMTARYRADALEPPAALPRAQLFCGLSQRWGGEIDVPLALGEETGARYGFGDVAVTTKYLLRDQTRFMPALVMGLDTAIPFGNPAADTGESGVEIEPFLAVLKQAHGLTFQGNVALGIRHGGAERECRTIYNGAVAVPLRHTRWAPLGEANGTHGPTGTAVLAFAPGLHYSLGSDSYIAFALPVTAYGAQRRCGGVLQFQMRVRGGS